MANKELIITAKLDKQQLKKDIDSLKNELNKGFTGTDNIKLDSLKSEFKSIAREFAAELRKNIDFNIKKVSGSSRKSSSSGTSIVLDEIRKKEVRVKEGHHYSQVLGRSFKDKKKMLRAESLFAQENAEKEQERKKQDDELKVKKELDRRRKELLKDPNRTWASKEEIAKFKERQSSTTIDTELEKDREWLSNLRAQQKQKSLPSHVATQEDIARFKQQQSSGVQDKNLEKDREWLLNLKKKQQKEKENQKRLLEDKSKAEQEIARKAADEFISKLKSGRLDINSLVAASRGGGFGDGSGGGGFGTLGRIMASRPAMIAGRAIGGAALAGSTIATGMEQMRSLRQLRAQRSFEQFQAVRQGGLVEADVLRSGREDTTAGTMGAIKGGASRGAGMGAAGATAGFLLGGPIGALIGGLGGLAYGAFTGGEAGYLEATQEEAETRKAEVMPMMQAQMRASQMAGTRLGTFAGGNLTQGGLISNEIMGTEFGFSQEETNRRLQEARRTLGGKETTTGLMAGMMDTERRLGINTNSQTQFLETIKGYGGADTATGAFEFQVDSIKKAMAQGLDASKTSKFLKTTSDYVTSNAGFANMDMSAVTDELSQLAGSFMRNSGRTSMTESDLSRAQTLKEQLKSESIATGGLAGLGNYKQMFDLSQQFNLNTKEFLGLRGASRDATTEQVSGMLQEMGRSQEEAGKIAEAFVKARKTSTLQAGEDLLGGKGAKYMFSGELGLTSEQLFARTQAVQGKAGVTAEQKRAVEGELQATAGIYDTTDFKSVSQQATIGMKEFTAGLSLLTEKVTKEEFSKRLQEFTTSLEQADMRLKSLGLSGGKNVRTNDPGFSVLPEE